MTDRDMNLPPDEADLPAEPVQNTEGEDSGDYREQDYGGEPLHPPDEPQEEAQNEAGA
jgi:hypothetical protein